MANLFLSVPKFIFQNMIGIIIVFVLFLTFTTLITIYNIKFVEPKTKVDKVIVVEKFIPENSILDEIRTIASQQHAGGLETSCSGQTNQQGCFALGSCIWVNATDGKEACVAGSPDDGPEDKCYKKNGQLFPWDKYYYEKSTSMGNNVIEEECEEVNCN